MSPASFVRRWRREGAAVANGGKVSDGKTINVVAPAGGVVAGEFYRINGWNGVCEVTTPAGQMFALNTDPTFDFYVQVLATDAPTIGTALYATPAGVLTVTATGNTLAAKCKSAKDVANNRAVVRILNVA